MAGYTVDNQLKGAAEETTAAATVTAAETATATKTVTVTARIRTATLMLKDFLVGTEDCFQRGSYDFLVSVRHVVFGGGRTIFLVWTKEKVVHTTLCTTYVEKNRPKTPSTSCFLGRMFQFLCTYVCFPLWKYDIVSVVFSKQHDNRAALHFFVEFMICVRSLPFLARYDIPFWLLRAQQNLVLCAKQPKSTGVQNISVDKNNTCIDHGTDSEATPAYRLQEPPPSVAVDGSNMRPNQPTTFWQDVTPAPVPTL
jgi:hypothetical protein